MFLNCPYCSSQETRVVDKRSVDEKKNWRRRECSNCGKRFTTYENLKPIKLKVVKRNGSTVDFNKNKIVKSVIKARSKKKLSNDEIEDLVDEIEKELLKKEEKKVTSLEIGELVLKHLKKVDPVAYVRFASVFREFDSINGFEKELMNLKVKKRVENEVENSTDLSMQVTSSKEELNDWDKSKIIKALIKETSLDESKAEDIAEEVERKLLISNLSIISTGLIRELVNNELITRGYSEQLKSQKMLGMPVYNLNKIIFNKSKENANIKTNNPEFINLEIAENTLKQFALENVFSKEVAEAHLTGAIHLHDLGYITRVYCSAHSPEYIKKYGLREQLTLSTTASPAKYASVLTGHILTFLASMQPYYAGALGLSNLNIFYAPFLEDKTDKELEQEAQNLIFGVAQGAFSRGGQTMFIDFNIHLGIPSYLKNVPAIGPGGEYTGKTYAEYEKTAQRFAKAMLKVWKKGDADGKVFTFPKCDLHINEESFTKPEQKELLMYACEVAAHNGSPYFIFDRDEITLSACCRLRTRIEDKHMLEHPESMRFCGFQNVTINLPQAAYKAGVDNLERFKQEVNKMMKIVLKAHLEKKEFIQELMKDEASPLWQLSKPSKDGESYVDLEKSTYIFGLIGLNEAVKFLTGEELHESEHAYKTGLEIVSTMYLKLKEYEKEHGLKFTLEESPAEGASLRLAKMDLKNFKQAKKLVRGDKSRGEVYYTNSVHFAPDARIDLFERIEKQGRFNNIIESGSITHVFIGEARPSAKAIHSLVKKTWQNTQSAQITISPEFTICRDCGKISAGYKRGE